MEVLRGVASGAGDSFSGLGMLLYKTGLFSKKHYTDLRPSFSCPGGVFLGDKKTIGFLLDIANKSNPLHDGFIFFNECGEMKKISQYFSPSPVDGIIPNECYGTRYRAAQYGSFLQGVILTGIVCSEDKKYFAFRKGRCIVL